MVFTSVPAYLDPPNWNNQQGQQQQRASGGGDAPLVPPVGPPATEAGTGLLPSSSPAASAAQARPNSMAERARLMRMPQPEPALKCPRCDSTNTKFCYYNNYSLSQPRHFCKTCRRYWTKGGSLRNVPVGGGCRRNKRSSNKSSSTSSAGAGASSKPSSSSATRQQQLPTSSSSPGGSGIIMPPGSLLHHQYLPFLGSMHQPTSNLGLAFSAGLPPLGMHVDTVDQFPVASGGASLDQWRMHQQQQQQPHQQQQFPFLSTGGVLDLQPTRPQQMYHQLGLEAANRGESSGAAVPAFTLGQTSGTTVVRPEGAMKLDLDDSKGQEMSLQRQYMAALRQGEGIWDGNTAGGGGDGATWPMNISGFRSSTTGGDGSGLL